MATIALPSSFRPESFSMRMSTNQRTFASPFGGSEQVNDMLNDRWTATVSIPRRGSDTQAGIEAFVNAMRGQTNTCNLWHMQRPVPRGTMRGTPTMYSNPALQGADFIIINATVGSTLLAGDLIGVGGLLLMVAGDTGADGAGHMGISLVNRLRKQIPAGTAVTWDRPSAPFRLMTNASVLYQPGYAEGVSLDFAEAIA